MSGSSDEAHNKARRHQDYGGQSRADWIRTSDPHVPNVVRYRAALLPEKPGIKNK
jgi:hypothetical protein